MKAPHLSAVTVVLAELFVAVALVAATALLARGCM
jgi:hypothetical protein